MNFLRHHHHFVVIAACLGGLIILLLIIWRTRSRKQVDVDSEVESHRIEERLATGKFSRAPSTYRRKVVDIKDHKKEENGS
jgi:hypothetical protein